MSDSDLPEGVINADPAGGWESGATADDETAERSADAAGSPQLSEAGSDADEPATDADGTVESDVPTQGIDPDLATNEED
ncbi:hypothetical protein ACIQLJ_13185 [Microbacterium sp. NPDC091313]